MCAHYICCIEPYGPKRMNALWSNFVSEFRKESENAERHSSSMLIGEIVTDIADEDSQLAAEGSMSSW